MTKYLTPLIQKYASLQPTFTERSRRLWAASEARSIGHGGILRLAKVTGLSRQTIERGVRELKRSETDPPSEQLPPQRSRQAGGGRKRLAENVQKLRDSLIFIDIRPHHQF